MTPSYPPPVDRLLAMGRPEFPGDWADYREMGITGEHVPELIRMLSDPELAAAGEDSAEVWAPVYAWRALGQLGAEAAVEPLVQVLENDDDDWAHEELPAVFGMLGPAAVEPLRVALARQSIGFDVITGATTANGLAEIAKRHPETRSAVVDILVRQLRWSGRQHPALNAFLVGDLIELKAVETAPLIEEIYAAGEADISVMGDWEDVQLELGLISERVTPRPRYWTYTPHLRPSPGTPKAAHGGAIPRGDVEKRRRKAEKAARRRNRKRR
ncbi:hypothetical protein [Longimicrobium sp.]|uniref:HEAT repeat domain-containing protein n=1 Tax=Longimicrobium sp. TaxID=2029185 RepID=UPI002CC90343|nr:hypothetical protein [Longimicrobium sp.]HSU13044.1 hypothetical protein [Longimicrobium sp.]